MGCVFSLLIDGLCLSLKHMYGFWPYFNIYDDKLLLCSLWGISRANAEIYEHLQARRGMPEWFHVR